MKVASTVILSVCFVREREREGKERKEELVFMFLCVF